MFIQTEIKSLFQQALHAAFPKVEISTHLVEITPATQDKFGHYQCNSAMKLTKILNTPPRQIAERLVEALQANKHSMLNFSKIEIAGPGFINLTLSAASLETLATHILKTPKFDIQPPSTHQKVVIDFSSPNIAKEMHVGHLRSTIIGDCIARTLEFLGYDVVRLNHIGDWGTQFGMLITYLKDQQSDLENHPSINFSLPELQTCYKEAKTKFDTDPEFKARSQQEVVNLQNHEATAYGIWQQICRISKEAYDEIYQLLDIKITDRGESFYNPMLRDIIQLFEKQACLKVSDGAKCVYVEGFQNRDGEPLPLIVQKKDGGFNYATTDLAALAHRIQQEKASWLIYVTDLGQSQHFNMVFKAAEMAGLYQPEMIRIDHVPFGLVLRQDGKKFKTRSGDTERLMDLLTTAIDKAKAILKERSPDIASNELELQAKKLGLNAIKYADLSNHRTSDYKFSYERMLQFEGNTAAFLSYAYVRIKSIQNKIGLTLDDLLQSTNLHLQEPSELHLALAIIRFPDVLKEFEKELLPHRITEYLFSLAEKFHAFFHHCRVEGDPQQNPRLLLSLLAAKILHQGFILLGLQPLEKM